MTNSDNTNKNLYNKYRPKSFSEIAGQEIVKQLLKKAFVKRKLLQSFLFYGSHGTGKTSLARVLAKAWNCEKFHEIGDVCNQCKNCRLIENNATIDICEVDSASNSGVDHVRELIQNSQYMPLDLDKKIYLLDECHNLSSSAWNALLKTIEEPSSDRIVFIFLTTNIHKLPDTIISRCQKYNFSMLSPEEMERVVAVVEKGEGREFDPESKRLLIYLAQGSARECISLMEQIFLSTSSPKIHLEDVEKVFALANKEEQLNFLELLARQATPGVRARLIGMVDDLVNRNIHLLNYFSSLLTISMDMYVYEMTGDLNLLKRIGEKDAKRLARNGLDYFDMSNKLFQDLKGFASSYSKGDWAKLALFRLFTYTEPDPLPPTQEEGAEQKDGIVFAMDPNKKKSEQVEVVETPATESTTTTEEAPAPDASPATTPPASEEPAPESAPDPEPTPIAEPAPEPDQEPSPEPTQESEPTPEPTITLSPEPDPAPTPDPVPEPPVPAPEAEEPQPKSSEDEPPKPEETVGKGKKKTKREGAKKKAAAAKKSEKKKIDPELLVPKSVEMKFFYNTLEHKRDDEKAKENYSIYQTLLQKEDWESELKDVLFNRSIVFPSNKVVTTDKTVLLLFKKKEDADEFNRLVTPDSDAEKELNQLFNGDYFWWAATINQMQFYKKYPKPDNEEIEAAFADKKDEKRFEELISILEDQSK